MLFVAHRRGTSPSTFLEEAMPMFEAMQMKPLDSVVYHYLPETSRTFDTTGREIRGALERSHTFLASFVELYCPEGGLCLELGCGTAPLLKACLGTGRLCVAMDSDIPLIESYVRPFICASQERQNARASTSHIDEEVDSHAGDNPYD